MASKQVTHLEAQETTLYLTRSRPTLAVMALLIMQTAVTVVLVVEQEETRSVQVVQVAREITVVQVSIPETSVEVEEVVRVPPVKMLRPPVELEELELLTVSAAPQ